MDKIRIGFWYGVWLTVFVFGLLMTVGTGQAQTQKIRIAFSSPSNTVAALIQPVAIGNTALRAQALTNRLVQVVALSPPHDYIVQKQASFKALAGPPEVGMPASGLFTTSELLTQKPQVVKSTLRGLIKANHFIERNREETIRIMLKWVKQSPEIAARSYELELAAISPDGQMTDRELENLMERLAGKKKSLNEVRDFSFVRQAIKEVDGK